MSSTPTPPVVAAAAAALEETPKETATDVEEPLSRQELCRRALEGDDDGEPLFIMMSQPTTALVVLSNQMLFKPDEDVIHLTVTAKEELANCLEEHVSLEMPVADGSLEHIHLVVRAMDVDRLFDETAFGKWNKLMQPGGELNIHIVADVGQVADSDVDMMRVSLLQAELKVTSQGDGPDGSKMLTGRKAGGPEEEEEETECSSSAEEDKNNNNKDKDDKTKKESEEETSS